MKKIAILLSLLIVFACEEDKDETPPTVVITSPQDGSTVSDYSVTITCMSTDNEGVKEVELWVDGVTTGVTDDTEPYSLEWNTTTYEYGSYTIIVRSYDTSGNTADSNPITLNLDKIVELWGESYSIENTTSLTLSNSSLTGSIPPEIGNLINLEGLYLNENQLTGQIPSEIGNLANLRDLHLYNNQLTGSIPTEIGNLTNLNSLYLYWNQLTGSIPTEIGNLTNLTYLDFDGNQLTGSIPSEIGNLTSLKELWLRSNQLTGSIPSGIGNLTSLRELYLSDNQLTGSITPEIGNLTRLNWLWLYNNQLTGEIPPEIGNLTNLNYLKLNNNQLTGKIPESICDLSIDWGGYNSSNHHQYFNISGNQLCPPYPSCINDYVDNQDTSNCN
jgi:Leucine-rich repeat (LRR) protein